MGRKIVIRLVECYLNNTEPVWHVRRYITLVAVIIKNLILRESIDFKYCDLIKVLYNSNSYLENVEYMLQAFERLQSFGSVSSRRIY